MNNQCPCRKGWQLVCCTALPIAARMCVKNNGASALGAVAHDSRLGGGELRVGELPGVVEGHQSLKFGDALVWRRRRRRCGGRAGLRWPRRFPAFTLLSPGVAALDAGELDLGLAAEDGDADRE